VFSDEEKKLGFSFLKNPDLMDEIAGDMELLGYVGEKYNKHLMYLCATSRKMENPISVLILSESSSGKSRLMEVVKQMMPCDEVVALTSLSDQALNYIPTGGLLHKLLILGEAVHSDVVEHQIREMLSSQELSRMVTVKDERTGMLSSKHLKTPVIVSCLMSSTNPYLNPENTSRYFLINVDESIEQTRRIHEVQRGKYTLKRHEEKQSTVPMTLKKHQVAQKLLKPMFIVNSFAKYLDFPDALMRTRRDHDRFMDLIVAVAYLRQYQKSVKRSGSLEYIECDLVDYRIAHDIMAYSVLPFLLSDLPRSVIRFYESVREYCQSKASVNGLLIHETSFTQREIRDKTDFLGKEAIKKYLKVLVEYEYLVSDNVNRGQQKHYSLVSDEQTGRRVSRGFVFC